MSGNYIEGFQNKGLAHAKRWNNKLFLYHIEDLIDYRLQQDWYIQLAIIYQVCCPLINLFDFSTLNSLIIPVDHSLISMTSPQKSSTLRDFVGPYLGVSELCNVFINYAMLRDYIT